MLRVVLVLLFFVPLCQPAFAQLSAVEAANVEAAARFIQTMGDPGTAHEIRSLAAGGKIKSGPLGRGENGDTTLGTITITPGVIKPVTTPLKESKEADYASIARLAATLVHENVHVKQSAQETVDSNLLSLHGGDSPHETEGWSEALKHEEQWADKALKEFEKAEARGAPPGELEPLAARARALAFLFARDMQAFMDNEYKPDFKWEIDGDLESGNVAAARLLKRAEKLTARLEKIREAIRNENRGTLFRGGDDEEVGPINPNGMPSGCGGH